MGSGSDRFDELLTLLHREHHAALQRARLAHKLDDMDLGGLRDTATAVPGSLGSPTSTGPPEEPPLPLAPKLLEDSNNFLNRSRHTGLEDGLLTTLSRRVSPTSAEDPPVRLSRSRIASPDEGAMNFLTRSRQIAEDPLEKTIERNGGVAAVAGFCTGHGGRNRRGSPALLTLEDAVINADHDTSASLFGTTPMAPRTNRSSKQRLESVGHAKLTFLGKTVKDMDQQRLAKQRQRFRSIFFSEEQMEKNVPYKEMFVKPSHIHRALQKRGLVNISEEDVVAVFLEFKALESAVEDSQTLGGQFGDSYGRVSETPIAISMSFLTFVDIICLEGLPAFVSQEMSGKVGMIQETLIAQDMDEIFERASLWRSHTEFSRGSANEMPTMESRPSKRHYKMRQRWFQVLDSIVAVVVVLSFLILGIQQDVAEDWVGWLVIEGLFTTIFVIEIVLKVCCFGTRVYCWGKDWVWNWVDIVVTITSVIELGMSIYTFRDSDADHSVSALRATVIIRLLRLVRMARLLKLLQSDMMRELANMLSGFLIGLPALWWVMFLLFTIIFVLAIIFNQVAGPTKERIPVCGPPDTIEKDFVAYDASGEEVQCKLHWLYGEEFFGDMTTSMFTMFRCMIGDCATRGGQSLIVHLSEGYGFRFEIVYAVGMILVVFGLFNIVTAIFVETTLSGLKHNDIQKKRNRLHEHKYVQAKVRRLLVRIQEIVDGCSYADEDLDDHVVLKTRLSEREFRRVMTDQKVQDTLEDLDVHSLDLLGLFDLFDPEGKGHVDVPRLLDTVMLVRGEPQKSDIIAAFVSLRALTHKFQGFQVLVLKNQQWLIEEVGRLARESAPDTAMPQSPSMNSPWKLDKAISQRRTNHSNGPKME